MYPIAAIHRLFIDSMALIVSTVDKGIGPAMAISESSARLIALTIRRLNVKHQLSLRPAALGATVVGVAIVLAQTGGAIAASPPPPSFAQCAVCHAVTAAAPKKLGPTLAGVAGKPAATRPGYAYSPALKGSGIVWTDAKLNQFLIKPAQMVPGNKMAFAGMSDPVKRAQVIAFLKTLR
jgi:cytochrome c